MPRLCGTGSVGETGPAELGSHSGGCRGCVAPVRSGRPALPNWGHTAADAAAVWHRFGGGARPARAHGTGVTQRGMPRLCGTGSVAGAGPAELGSRSGVCRGCVAPGRWRGPAQRNWGHGTACAAVLWHQFGGGPGRGPASPYEAKSSGFTPSRNSRKCSTSSSSSSSSLDRVRRPRPAPTPGRRSGCPGGRRGRWRRRDGWRSWCPTPERRQLDLGEEGAVAQLGDDDPLDGHAEGVEQVPHEIVGHRPRASRRPARAKAMAVASEPPR